MLIYTYIYDNSFFPKNNAFFHKNITFLTKILYLKKKY